MEWSRLVAISEEHNHERAVLESVEIQHLFDDTPDVSYLETDEPEDQERLAAFYRDEWHCIGIRAVANIRIPMNNRRPLAFLSQTVKTGGLWDVASDADDEHLDSVAQDEIAELEHILQTLNVVIPDDYPITTKIKY